MKTWLSSIALLLLVSATGFAEEVNSITGLFFNVVSLGSTLTIKTLVPNHQQPYPQAGIQILTPGYRLSNTAGDCSSYNTRTRMCIFSVSDTVPKVISITGPVGAADVKLCLDGVGSLTCQHYTYRSTTSIINQRLYVVSSSQNAALEGYVSVCALLNNGATLGVCSESSNALLLSPQAMTFDPTGNTAYLSNFGDGHVVGCGISATTGFLTTCVSNPTGIPAGLGDYSLIGSVGVTASNTFVFVPYYATNAVLSCPISGGGVLGACVDSGVGGLFNGPNAVTIDRTGNFAYIPNQGAQTVSHGPFNGTTVSRCMVIGGTLGNCITAGSSFSGPLSVSFNAAGNFAYVANGNNSTISTCPVNPNGTFGVCTNSGSSQSFSFGSPPEDAVANMFMSSAYSYGYVPNSELDTISICSLGSHGGLGTCTSVGNPQFITPTGIAVSPSVSA